MLTHGRQTRKCSFKRMLRSQGLVAHGVCKDSTQEAEAGRSRAGSLQGQHSKILALTD